MTNNYVPDVYDIYIMVQIEHHEGITQTEIARKLPFDQTRVSRRMTPLVDLGLIQKKGRTKYSEWSLTEDGRKWLIAQGYLK